MGRTRAPSSRARQGSDWGGTDEELTNTNDLATVSGLSEQLLNQALELRYNCARIYTYVGDILVAINPFRALPLYTPTISTQYMRCVRGELEPHLYALADSAYHAMLNNQLSQVCVISGESGAGKTESAKLFVSHVIDVSGGRADSRSHTSIEERIIQINPILEAFGNAQTVKNDNSSRFGKFLELQFSRAGLICGASLSHYLLEKSRLVLQNDGERNFHIFEYLFGGADEAMLANFKLASTSQFRYLAQERLAEDSKEKWAELHSSLLAVGFTTVDVEELVAVLAAVLHLGNLVFVESGDSVRLASTQTLDVVAAILMVDGERLLNAVLTQAITMKGETVHKRRDTDQCGGCRDALAKSLYARTFGWLVDRIDALLRPSAETDVSSVGSVGVLDIFGFEDFELNSFEQLCINLANEQLQFFFNQHIFASELKAYVDEGIDPVSVFFTDNRSVLDMFYRRPLGLLALLDEESRFPKGTDESFIMKLNGHLATDAAFKRVHGGDSFGVCHYAGTVVYDGNDFLEKNRDTLPGQVVDVLASCKMLLARTLFTTDDAPGKQMRFSDKRQSFNLLRMFSKKHRKDGKDAPAPAAAAAAVKPARALGRPSDSTTETKSVSFRVDRISNGSQMAQATVSAQFKDSLAMLMARLAAGQPHFVRCIKPNDRKQPNNYQPDFVLKQLRYTGMLEATRIRREGFPYRLPFEELFAKYRFLAYRYCDKKPKPSLASCNEIMQIAQQRTPARPEGGAGWLAGKTMIFLKYWVLDRMQQLATATNESAAPLQACCRGYLARRRVLPQLVEARRRTVDVEAFLNELSSRARKVGGLLAVLADEDSRRANAGVQVEQVAAPPKATQSMVGSVLQAVMGGAKKDTEFADQKALAKDAARTRRDVNKWWIKYERHKGMHCDEQGTIYAWFHGLIDRTEAEDLLVSSPVGTFLVRVSDRFNGYVLSFCFRSRVRHYKIVPSPNGGYEVQGSNVDFGTLEELLDYYRTCPLDANDNDLLGDALTSKHDLNLGMADEIDDMYHDTAMVGKARPQPKNEMPDRRARMNTVGSMASLVFPRDNDAGDKMPRDEYLLPGDQPAWLRGNLTRELAEAELRGRGRHDGFYLVREKVISASRVVFVLSMCYQGRFRHHLVEKARHGIWTLDNVPMGQGGSLNELVDSFHYAINPHLGTMLRADVPREVSEPLPPPVSSRPRPAMSTAYPDPSDPPPGVGMPLLPAAWRCDDVVHWLNTLGMGHYASNFLASRIDGVKLISLGELQLRHLVPHVPDRTMISSALDSLRATSMALSPAPPGQRRASAAQPRSSLAMLDELLASPMQAAPVNAQPGRVTSQLPVTRREIKEYYLDKGLFGQAPPESVLRDACKSGNFRKVVELLFRFDNLRVDAVKIGGSGKTALYLAAERGHFDICERLLQSGANPMRRDEHGVCAIEIAQANKHRDVVALLKKAVDPTALMPDQPTPLPRSAQHPPTHTILHTSRAGVPLPPVPAGALGPRRMSVDDANARRSNVYAEPGAEASYLVPALAAAGAPSYEEHPLPALTSLPGQQFSSPIASPRQSPPPMMQRPESPRGPTPPGHSAASGPASPGRMGVSPSPPTRPLSIFSNGSAPVPPPRGQHTSANTSASNLLTVGGGAGVGGIAESTGGASEGLAQPSGSTTLTSGMEADDPQVLHKKDSVHSDAYVELIKRPSMVDTTLADDDAAVAVGDLSLPGAVDVS